MEIKNCLDVILQPANNLFKHLTLNNTQSFYIHTHNSFLNKV